MLNSNARAAIGLAVLGCLAAWLWRSRPEPQRMEPAPAESVAASRPEPARSYAQPSAAIAKPAARSAEAPKQDALVQGIREATVYITSEEREILAKYTVEGLSQAVAEADRAYAESTPENRAEADRRYLLVLNLAAKVAPPPPPTDPALAARQEEYLAQRARDEARLQGLPEREREERLAELKDQFFAPENAAQDARSAGGKDDEAQ